MSYFPALGGLLLPSDLNFLLQLVSGQGKANRCNTQMWPLPSRWVMNMPTACWLSGCTPVTPWRESGNTSPVLGDEVSVPQRVVLAIPGHQVASPVLQLPFVHAHTHTPHACTHTMRARTRAYTVQPNDLPSTEERIQSGAHEIVDSHPTSTSLSCSLTET